MEIAVTFHATKVFVVAVRVRSMGFLNVFFFLGFCNGYYKMYTDYEPFASPFFVFFVFFFFSFLFFSLSWDSYWASLRHLFLVCSEPMQLSLLSMSLLALLALFHRVSNTTRPRPKIKRNSEARNEARKMRKKVREKDCKPGKLFTYHKRTCKTTAANARRRV